VLPLFRFCQEVPSVTFLLPKPHRIFLKVAAVSAVVPVLAFCLALSPGAAHAAKPGAVDKVTDLNKKALGAYATGEFDKAKKLLKEALDLCGSGGLEGHPIAARTHIHMGVVMIGGLKQRDLGIKQFQKALEIQPDIKVTKNVATEEIQAAFEEATKSAPVATRAPARGEGGGAKGDKESPDSGGGAEGEPATGIVHTPIARGRRGLPITVIAKLPPDGFDKVVLYYRPDRAEEYVEKEMVRAGDKFAAEIPSTATKGARLSYYMEAVSEDPSAPVAFTAGSEGRPFTVALAKGKAAKCDEDDENCEEGGGGGEAGPPFYLGVMAGSGLGYTVGKDELNPMNRVNPAGFAPASIAHIAPEIGYFFSPQLRVSAQLRLQMVSGATPRKVPGTCGADELCTPASLAPAVFVKGAWFFGSGALRPYISLAAGGGRIPHLIRFKDSMMCGADGMQVCVSTVGSGPVYIGPGGGILYAITPNFGLVLEAGSVVGVPAFTFHIDVNGGVALRL
jgi:hypothetical protein